MKKRGILKRLRKEKYIDHLTFLTFYHFNTRIICCGNEKLKEASNFKDIRENYGFYALSSCNNLKKKNGEKEWGYRERRGAAKEAVAPFRAGCDGALGSAQSVITIRVINLVEEQALIYSACLHDPHCLLNRGYTLHTYDFFPRWHNEFSQYTRRKVFKEPFIKSSMSIISIKKKQLYTKQSSRLLYDEKKMCRKYDKN